MVPLITFLLGAVVFLGEASCQTTTTEGPPNRIDILNRTVADVAIIHVASKKCLDSSGEHGILLLRDCGDVENTPSLRWDLKLDGSQNASSVMPQSHLNLGPLHKIQIVPIDKKDSCLTRLKGGQILTNVPCKDGFSGKVWDFQAFNKVRGTLKAIGSSYCLVHDPHGKVASTIQPCEDQNDIEYQILPRKNFAWMNTIDNVHSY